jgi:hypothetical protein
MKLAALVGLDGGGESDSLCPPQVCLSGDGTAGAVGLAGRPVVRRRGAAIPFNFEAVDDTPLIAGLGLLGVGNAQDRLASTGTEGEGAADRVVNSIREEDATRGSSLIRLLLVVVSVVVTSEGNSFSFVVGGREPKEGDLNRLYGRELPTPCHRHGPFGFLLNILRGAGVGVSRVGVRPRAGDGGELENRKRSGLSFSCGSVLL